MDESTRRIRMKQWMKIIQDWSASGQPKNQWCSENGVTLRQFYYWQRIIRQELSEASGLSTDLVPIGSSAPCLVDITPQPMNKTSIAAEELPATVQAMATIKTDRLEIHLPVNASADLLNCVRGIIYHAL